MISDEVAGALARFFDQIGPSHDDLDRLFARAGVMDVDPKRGSPIPVGKMKRVRGVLYWASDNDPEAGSDLVRSLVDAVRSVGGFRPGSENYPGEDAVLALHEAFANVGYELGADGVLRARVLDGLEGADLTEALWAYVRRARSGSSDSALLLGTAKDLTEATARHVLVERTGAYPTGAHFQTTLWQAFERLGLACPDVQRIEISGVGPWEGVEQALFILACAVNRYRNAEGVGHGRPDPSLATTAQSRIAAEAAALVAEPYSRPFGNRAPADGDEVHVSPGGPDLTGRYAKNSLSLHRR